MKAYKIFKVPTALLFLIVITSLFFQSCKPDDPKEDDDVCDTCIVVYKPNIYIYPETELFLTLTLDFPEGGKVLYSIPEYGNGWSFRVNKSGIIDNEFEFLFYESSQPDVWQMEKGWCIPSTELSGFFQNNLSRFGFSGREIDDFLDYWIPRLNLADFYTIYPQTSSLINRVIDLNFSTDPDHILRLFYVLQESDLDNSAQLAEPVVESFLREGFVVTEWGVILK